MKTDRELLSEFVALPKGFFAEHAWLMENRARVKNVPMLRILLKRAVQRTKVRK